MPSNGQALKRRKEEGDPMTKPETPPQALSSAWLPLIASCWALIGLLNISFDENPVVYLTLVGYLAMLAPTTAIVLYEERRQSCAKSPQVD